MWSSFQSAPINTLFHKCLPFTNLDHHDHLLLPIHVKQEIFDYLIREKIETNSNLICDLLNNGGLFSLDLWALFNNNNYTESQITEIFQIIMANCHNLSELCIGGYNWIYNNRIVNGPFKNLLKSNLKRLKRLTLQQTSGYQDLLIIFESCPNLISLEISQPSLDCCDLFNLEPILSQSKYDRSRQSLKEIKVPSSCNNFGLVKLLSFFPNIEWLKCRHFEQFLEILQNHQQFIEDEKLYHDIQKAIKVSSKLKGLSITHPLSDDVIYIIVKYCPLIEDLSIKVQDGMELGPIVQLKHLRKLELHNSQSMPSSYLQQVIPVLEKIGSKLDSLSLQQFSTIELTSLAQNCRNLKQFSAQWFTTISFNRTMPTLGLSKLERTALQQTFSNLRYIRLRPLAQRQLPQDAIVYILKNAFKLEYLELYCCHNLDDFHFLKILQNNSLQNLKHLILRHGHSITKPFLNTFANSLKHLQYLDCGQPLFSKAELIPNNENNLE